MKKMKKRCIAIALIFAMTVGAVGANTQNAEAGLISWAAKKIIKRVIVNKVKTTVKTAYQKKQASFKVPGGRRKIYVKGTVKVKPLISFGNRITWSSANRSIATVSSDGIVKGQRAGTTSVIARTNISHKTTYIKIIVRNRGTVYRSKRLKVNEKYLVVEDGIKSVTSSNSSSVKAYYDKNGTGCVVIKGLKAGTSKVTITKNNTKKIVYKVTVRKINKPQNTHKPEATKKPSATHKPETTKEPSVTPAPDTTSEPTMTPAPTRTPTPYRNPIIAFATLTNNDTISWNAEENRVTAGAAYAVSQPWTEADIAGKDAYKVYDAVGSTKMFEIYLPVKNHFEDKKSTVDDDITVVSDNEAVCRPQAVYYEGDTEDEYQKSNGRLRLNLEALSNGKATLTITTGIGAKKVVTIEVTGMGE